MKDIQVTVRGYGLVVNDPADILINALNAAGYHVVADNPYSDKPIQLEENLLNKPIATVKVIHVPWPG